MRTAIIMGTLLAGAVTANVALAQSDPGFRHPQRPICSPPVWMHHASTYEEGVLRGWADFRRALGEFRYNSSLAAINHQEAVRLALQNDKQHAEDYFQKKALNKAARFGDQTSRRTQEQLTRTAKERLPDRLSSHEYHRSLGKLVWPAVFQGAEFAAERAAINQAISERTVENSGKGTANYEVIKSSVDRLDAKLKVQVDRLSTTESIAARKFLKSLAHEARFPLSVDLSGLAAR